MPGLPAFRLAPGARRRTTAGALAFTAAQRVVDGVHRHAAALGPLAEPAALARLADREQLVLGVPDLADRRQAAAVHQPHLRRAEAERDVLALLGHDLRARAGGPGELAALPDLELDVVHRRTERDFRERQRVARPAVRARPRDHDVALVEPLRVQDVALLPVGVHDQGDAGAPVRVVLDLRDLAWDPELVALEVDLPVLALVP